MTSYRQVWTAWGYLVLLLSIATIGLLSIAIYSFVIGDIAFGFLVAVFSVLCGLSPFVRAGLGGLSPGAPASEDPLPTPRERDVPTWAMGVVRAGPLIWAVAGVTVLTAGIINAVQEGDRALTVLCFAFGGTLVSTALTYALIRHLAKNQIGQR
jgi:hypothetical protein